MNMDHMANPCITTMQGKPLNTTDHSSKMLLKSPATSLLQITQLWERNHVVSFSTEYA